MGLLSKIKNKLVVCVIEYNGEKVKSAREAQELSGGIGKMKALFGVHYKEKNGRIYAVITANNPLMNKQIMDATKTGIAIEAQKSPLIKGVHSVEDWEELTKETI